MVPPVKREHYDTPWEALVALGKFVLQTQGLNAFLLCCLLGWNIYSDYRYNDKAESRAERIERCASLLDVKFDAASSAMAAAAVDRKHAADTLDTIQRQQAEDRRNFEEFQKDIRPVIEAVKVLLERIDREANSNDSRARRYEGGEGKRSIQVEAEHGSPRYGS